MAAMKPSVVLVSLFVFFLAHSVQAEKCFFTGIYCSNYCCTNPDRPFVEYCCSDCSKANACHIVAFKVIGILVGVFFLLGIIGVIVAAICCGCILSKQTGRAQYRGRYAFWVPANQRMTAVRGQQQPLQTGAYPPQQGAYPPQQGAYPPQQGGYPPQQGAYPPQQGAYPPQQGAYPPQQGAYPPQPSAPYTSEPSAPYPTSDFGPGVQPPPYPGPK